MALKYNKKEQMASNELIPDHLKGDFSLLCDLLKRMKEQDCALAIRLACDKNPQLKAEITRALYK